MLQMVKQASVDWIAFEFPTDPGSPSENGFMEPKYHPEEVIGHPNHQLGI